MVARQYTSLLDQFGPDLRDPYNNLVLILTGVAYSTLVALGELLYTGKATLTSEQSKEDLLSFLNEGLVPIDESVSVAADPITLTEEVTEEKPNTNKSGRKWNHTQTIKPKVKSTTPKIRPINASTPERSDR